MEIDIDNRSYLLNILDLYEHNFNKIFHNNFNEQKDIIENFKKFIKSNANCFARSNQYGHITGSAFVVDKNFTKVLFTYHAKLHLWLQLGGHPDGEHIIQNVAFKEACEESGIDNFDFIDILKFPTFASSQNQNEIIPFDLDVHLIPERKNEPAHYHYDVRFVLVAKHENFKISSESLDLKWIDLNDITNYTTEISTLRQVNKLKYLLNIANV